MKFQVKRIYQDDDGDILIATNAVEARDIDRACAIVAKPNNAPVQPYGDCVSVIIIQEGSNVELNDGIV